MNMSWLRNKWLVRTKAAQKFSTWVLATGLACVAVGQPRSVAFASAAITIPNPPANVRVDGLPAAATASTAMSGALAGTALRALSTAYAGAVGPPNLPAPSLPGDIVGFGVGNFGVSSTAPRYMTFGQVFAQGTVQSGDTLVARAIGGTGGNDAVQMDPLASWPDGSIKFAAITLAAPALQSGAEQMYMLQRVSPTAPATPLNWSALPFNLSVAINITSPTVLQQTIDLHSGLMQALAGSPDVWVSGPQAVQARVDVPLTQSLHLTADITGYKDGVITADVQFNNDLASVSGDPAGPVLPALSYTVTVALNGVKQSYRIPAQYQYQDWHTIISSNGPADLDVLHDPAYVERTGALVGFDLTGVSASTLNGFESLLASSGFGSPLAANGVHQYMGDVGGRPDIGYTTQANASWLVTQSPVTAAVAMMQGDAGGAVPWNVRLSNGHWLTPADYPNVWNDGRSGQGGLVGLTNGAPTGANQYSGWSPDRAHMPDLAYVPYLMTASRWYLDRLNAQAAYSLAALWPVTRNIGGYTDIVTNTLGNSQQVRAAAWSMRGIIEAAWIGKAGSWDQSYFSQVESDNWSWMHSEESALNAAGHIAGFWFPSLDTYYFCAPTAPGCSPSSANPPAWIGAAPWQQDFLTGIVIMGAEMGNSQALQIAEWERNWVIGRFLGTGMNPHDGCAYNIIVGTYPQTPGGTPGYFTDWSQVEGAMTAAHISNGSGWTHSNGYYCQLARSVLGGLLTLNPADTQARSALSWLDSSGAPLLDPQSLANSPNFDVVPLQ